MVRSTSRSFFANSVRQFLILIGVNAAGDFVFLREQLVMKRSSRIPEAAKDTSWGEDRFWLVLVGLLQAATQHDACQDRGGPSSLLRSSRNSLSVRAQKEKPTDVHPGGPHAIDQGMRFTRVYIFPLNEHFSVAEAWKRLRTVEWVHPSLAS